MFETCQPFGFLAQGPQNSGAEICHPAVAYVKFLTHKTLEHNPMSVALHYCTWGCVSVSLLAGNSN